MSTGKIVLLFTIVFNVSVPCFGAGLFLMPTTFWNSAPRSNQITQDSAQEETKVPESIEAQIEEPIAYELKMAKPLEGTCICHFNFGATKALPGLFNLVCRKQWQTETKFLKNSELSRSCKKVIFHSGGLPNANS